MKKYFQLKYMYIYYYFINLQHINIFVFINFPYAIPKFYKFNMAAPIIYTWCCTLGWLVFVTCDFEFQISYNTTYTVRYQLQERVMSKKSNSFVTDLEFCPTCGTILPLPGMDDYVTCKLCGYKIHVQGRCKCCKIKCLQVL